MNVLLLSYADVVGGAARAAYRLHRTLLSYNVESRMCVRVKQSDDWRVEAAQGKIATVVDTLRGPVMGQVTKLQRSSNLNLHSANWTPSKWAREINNSGDDVINLHWVGGETLSIEDIGKIQKPVVWTLHDMWPFCGMEHYTTDDAQARWRVGYDKQSCPVNERRFLDLDKYVWQRKKRAWCHPMHIVAPSKWLADCAKASVLFSCNTVSVIPNVLNTELYKPRNIAICREIFDFPQHKKIVLFGAIGAESDTRKGYRLLVSALHYLAEQVGHEHVLCVIFGQSEPQHVPDLPFEMRWMGHIHDDITLSLLYSAASVMIVPSRQENLPQTATEAQACGCPVVAFNCTGLPDAVVHRETGYLATPYDPVDMAAGIKWILEDHVLRQRLSETARERAVRLWSADVVVPQYLAVYEQAIEEHRRHHNKL